MEQWRRFVTWVGGLLGGWGATLWTATLETNKDGKHHAHLMVEFTQRQERDVKDFTFEGLRPNAAALGPKKKRGRRVDWAETLGPFELT